LAKSLVKFQSKFVALLSYVSVVSYSFGYSLLNHLQMVGEDIELLTERGAKVGHFVLDLAHLMCKFLH